MRFVNAADPFLQEILVKPQDWKIPKTDTEKIEANIEKLIPTFYSLRKKLNAK